MYALNYKDKKTLQLSNDAFFMLYQDEEPIDDENREEAFEIAQMFPNGFLIADDWDYVEDSDIIEATFIPYTKSSFDYDMYFDTFNGWQFQVKLLKDNKIITRYYKDDSDDADFMRLHETTVKVINGKHWAESWSGSVYPMYKMVKKPTILPR